MPEYTPYEMELLERFEDYEAEETFRVDDNLTDRDKIEMARSLAMADNEFALQNTAVTGPYKAEAYEDPSLDARMLDTSSKWNLKGFTVQHDANDAQLENYRDPAAKVASGLVDPSQAENIKRGGVYAYGAHNTTPSLWGHEFKHNVLEGDEEEIKEAINATDKLPKNLTNHSKEEIYIRLFDLYRGIGEDDYDYINGQMADLGYRINAMNKNKDVIKNVNDVVNFIDEIAPKLAKAEAREYLMYSGIPKDQQPYKYSKSELKDATKRFMDMWERRKQSYVPVEDMAARRNKSKGLLNLGQ